MYKGDTLDRSVSKDYGLSYGLSTYFVEYSGIFHMISLSEVKEFVLQIFEETYYNFILRDYPHKYKKTLEL